MATRNPATPRSMNYRLFALVAFLALVALFALQGGEFGTTDLWKQGKRRALLEQQIDSLRREVDSLEAVKKLVLTDPATQERIAREEFGMVRGDKEVLYRFAESDSAGGDSAERAAQSGPSPIVPAVRDTTPRTRVSPARRRAGARKP